MGPRLAGVPAFVHVAEQRSFRAAAQRLGVTPTAVSKAVSRLEEHLGVRLLNRTSRRVSLTAEGAVYLRHCREALDRLQAGEDELTRSAQLARGPLRVSLSFVLGRLIAAALPRLIARNPRLRVQLSFTDREVDLAGEEIDVAVRIGPLAEPALIARPLRAPRWVTVASPAYLAQAGAIDDWRDLERHPCLRFVRPGGGVTAWRFLPDPDGEPVRFRPESPVVMDCGELLVDAAVAGLGVSQVFDFMAAGPIRSGALVEVLRHQSAPGPPVHALYLPRRRRSPGVQAFLAFLEEVMGLGG